MGGRSPPSKIVYRVGIGSVRYLFRFGRFCIKTLYETHLVSRKGTKHSRVAHAMLPSHIVSHDMKLACHFPCFSLSKT